MFTHSPARMPAREDAESVAAQAQAWRKRPDLVTALNAVPQAILVLNASRQVIFANTLALATAGVSSVDELLGLRPGDALDCDRSHQGSDGCGSAEGCKSCGAFRALAGDARRESASHDCMLLQFGTARAMHFRVTNRPLTFDGQSYSVVTLVDISNEHRRRNLERIFFHDLLNTVGAMSGYLQLLDSVPDGEREQMCASLLRLVDTLVAEIRSQRDLVLAENNELPVRPSEVSTLTALKEVAAAYRGQPIAAEKYIFLGEGACNVPLHTDKGLLVRVLGNLTKNALEASVAGDHVLLGCTAQEDGGVAFWVQNRASMPREVQLQLFHRAFSTKGTGRGLGTYSVKLLTTRYLKGEVSFTSSPEAGTRFTVHLPRTCIPATSTPEQPAHSQPISAAALFPQTT